MAYLTTGEARYLETAKASRDHIEQGFFIDSDCTVDCVPFNSRFSSGETRNQGRALRNMVMYYRLHGDLDDLTKAFDMYKHAIYPGLEAINKSYWDWNIDPVIGFSHAICGGNDCDAHVMYNNVVVEGLLPLYDELIRAGRPEDAAEVSDTIIAEATWARDYIFTNWYSVSDQEDVTCGTYKDTRYFPCSSKLYWDHTTKFSKAIGPAGSLGWAMRFVNAFAFAYVQTDDATWLNLAHVVFKDSQFYWDTIYEDYITVRTEAKPPSGHLETSNAYGKTGDNEIRYPGDGYYFSVLQGDGPPPIPPSGAGFSAGGSFFFQ